MSGYLISEELLRALQTYLSQRPWREVHEAMDALQRLPSVTLNDRENDSSIQTDETTALRTNLPTPPTT